MLSVNEELGTVDESPRLVTYIEKTYFPSLRLQAKTIKGYRDIYEQHFADRLGEHTLASFKTPDVSAILQTIVDKDGVAKNTVKHIKSFLSGIYTFARNKGDFDGANPVQGAILPKNARGEQATYAYELAEEKKMMMAVRHDLRCLAAIATASWSGVSVSELEGLCWEDRRDGCWVIARGIVEGNIGAGKNEHRRNPVPIIAPLARILDRYHRSIGSPSNGWVFPSENPEKPMRMANLFRRHIKPALKKAKIVWQGWHAFRRGLATNLHEMGVADDVIQKILRHAAVETTQRHYRKTRVRSVQRGMKVLERKVESFVSSVGRRPRRQMLDNVRQSRKSSRK